MIEGMVTSAIRTGYAHTPIRRMLDAGKQTFESKKAEEERVIQEKKKVQTISQIHEAKEKVIDTRYWEGLPLGYTSQGEVIDTRYGENIDLSE